MDPFMGEIRLFAGNYAPVNWALCQGQILQINIDQALYSILGTTYGGDGITTYALPDLRSSLQSFPAGITPIICINGVYPTRN